MKSLLKAITYLMLITFISCTSPSNNNSSSDATNMQISNSDDVFSGSWKESSNGGQINIQKNGDTYLVKITRPANNWTVYNGTWSAKIIDGNLSFDVPVVGKATLIFLKDKSMLLFKGDEYYSKM